MRESRAESKKRSSERPAGIPGARRTRVFLAMAVVAAMALVGVTAAQTFTPVTAGAGTATPNAAYVAQVYQDLLGRQPDVTGQAYWTNVLDTATPRGAVAWALVNSDEYRSRVISGIYQKLLLRTPDASGLAYWVGQVGQGMTFESFEAMLIGSDEYYASASKGKGDPATFVNAMYHDLLGRAADGAGSGYFVSQLQSGVSRGQVASGVISGQEHLQGVVDGYYQQFLNRDVDAAGLAYWVGQLQAGARDELIVALIIASDEYYQLATAGSTPPTTTTTGTTTTTATTTSTTTGGGGGGPAVTGAWSAPANSVFIMQHVALLPGSSKVVFFQDGGGAGTLDPNTGQVVQQPAGYNLFCAGQTILANGKVFVIGGDASVSPPPAAGSVNTTLYDPATGTWSLTAPMHLTRWYPTATKLPDGRVLATSGSNNGCTSCYVQTPEIYDPATNQWTLMNASANLAVPSYPFMFVLPDGRLLQSGAFEAPYSTNVLNVATQMWSSVDSRVIDAGSAVMYQPGKILRAGSSGSPGSAAQTATAAAYTLDMTSASPSLQPTSSMHNARAFLNLTMLPDGTALATGGEVNHDITSAAAASHAAEVWSPATGQWTTLASNVSPRYYHSTSVLLPDGRILNGGGWGPGSGTQTNFEIFSPPYLFKGARPTITSAPSNVTYNSSYSLGTPNAANIAKVALIPPAAVTHNFDENNRYVPLSFTVTDSGHLQITTPPNANYAPPGPYMLWIVDNNGVPSVASWTNIG